MLPVKSVANAGAVIVTAGHARAQVEFSNLIYPTPCGLYYGITLPHDVGRWCPACGTLD